MGHGTSSSHSSQRNGPGEGVPQMPPGRRLHRFGSAQLGQNTGIAHISRAGKDKQKSLLTRIKCLDEGDYQLASDLQKEMQVKIEKLTETYVQYKKNLF